MPQGRSIDPSFPTKLKFDVWDTAGQDDYIVINKLHFQGAHCVIITFAVDSPKSFSSVENHYNNIKQICDENALIVLVGNKCDLDARYIQFDDLAQKADDLSIQMYLETSALPERRETIDQLFTEIAVKLCEMQIKPKHPSVKLTNPQR